MQEDKVLDGNQTPESKKLGQAQAVELPKSPDNKNSNILDELSKFQIEEVEDGTTPVVAQGCLSCS